MQEATGIIADRIWCQRILQVAKLIILSADQSFTVLTSHLFAEDAVHSVNFLCACI